jgi:ParB/RepB/Spo0J family partition protein
MVNVAMGDRAEPTVASTPPVMTPLHSHCRDIDLHLLDLRFASSRLIEPQAMERLAQSIERCGQIVPCIVVAAPDSETGSTQKMVLVDGYRRVAALRRLGRDTAGVEQWLCDLTQALMGVLARAQDRPFAYIEQALLLRALMAEQKLSQHEVARRCGRDVSWVSRRLQLICGLPDAVLTAVREGTLSSWAASRVFAPLARANSEHAERLLVELAKTPLTTRELLSWFAHYEKSSRSARERMVSRPRLFIDTLVANAVRNEGTRLRDGPEGECIADLRCLEAVIARLRKRVATLRPLPPPLVAAAPRLRASIKALTDALEQEERHDPDRDLRHGAQSGCTGAQPA